MDQVVVEPHAEMADGDTDEQNPCHTEFDPCDFQLTESDTRRDDQRQNQHGVRHTAAPESIVPEKQIMKQFHIAKPKL